MINNFMNPNMMALLGAAQGLLQSSGASPRQITMGEALGNGLQGGMQGMQQGIDMQMRGQQMEAIKNEAQMRQQKLMRDMEARQILQSTIDQQASLGKTDPRSIGNALITTGHPDLISQGLNFLKAAPKAKSAVKEIHNGQAVYRPLMDTGEFGQASDAPAAEKLMQINRGSQIDLANPYTGQAQTSLGVGMSPGQAASLSQAERHFGQSQGLAQQKFALDQLRAAMEMDPKYQASKAGMIAAGKESALNQVKSTQELPRVIQQGEQTIKLVDDLLNHPGFKMSVGKSAPIGSALSLVPGTDSASFDIALNQLKGKQFLEAFESLKGGGQITQIEGEKATQAMSRMEKANTEDEFIRASREFQSIIQQGIGRAKAKAGVSQQPMQGGVGGFKIERLD